MQRIAYLLAFILMSCEGRSQYFEAKGIIDRTEELSGDSVWTALNDKERLDGYTRIDNLIFGGEIACNVKPLKNIDLKTFKVLPGTKYAKDANHAYYPLEVLCFDGVDCAVCVYNKIVIDSAHPETFVYLDKDYATDGRLVFFRGRLLDGADGVTFKVVKGPAYFYFATDKNHVYKHGNIFSDADPSSFYYDKNDSRNDTSDYQRTFIIGDMSNEWKFIPPDQIIKIEKK